MENIELMLADHPFFSGMKPEHISNIAGCASNVRFEQGQFISREGGDADSFYLIRHGRVSIEFFARNKGPITIETLSSGDIVGWSWLLPPFKWRFDARALELVRAIAVKGDCLRNKCETNPDLGYDVMIRFSRVITRELNVMRMQLLDIYGNHE